MLSFTTYILGRLRRLLSFKGVTSKDSITEIFGRAASQVQFTESYYQRLFERHVTQVKMALEAGGKQVSQANLVRYMHPEDLLDLSYDLPHAKGVQLRTYLSDLPERIWPLFIAAQDRLQVTLGC